MNFKTFIALLVVIAVLFGGLIAFFNVYPELKFKYYFAKLQSADIGEREEAVSAFLELPERYRTRLLNESYGIGKTFSAGAAVVFAKSPKFDYTSIKPAETISFAYALSNDTWAREKVEKTYLSDLGQYLFKIRPGIRMGKYYTALYQCRKYSQINYESVPEVLDFFNNMQAPDGRWFSEGATRDGDLRTTAVVLLALFGNGHTHQVGELKKAVRRGLNFLKRQMDNESGIFSEDTITHAWCTMLFAEGYAITKDDKMQKVAVKSLNHLVTRILPDGGFPSKLGGNESDIMSTVWAAFALKSAHVAGLHDPIFCPNYENMSIAEKSERNRYKTALRIDIKNYFTPLIEKVEDHHSTAPIVIAGIFSGMKCNEPPMSRAADLIMNYPPSWENENDAEYIYLGTYSLSKVRGKKWAAWKEPLMQTLNKHQESWLGNTWPPVMGAASKKYGRIFTSALNVLSLEIYYRYRRLSQ
jgi:hypothetical protein